MYTLDSSFKNRTIAGMFSALTFIYFYNNPDNFDAIKLCVRSSVLSSYNIISKIFTMNFNSIKLVENNVNNDPAENQTTETPDKENSN